MEKDGAKTPEYVRRAQKAYMQRVDRILCTFPLGTRDRIEKQGVKVGDYIKGLVLSDLERRETGGAS